MKQKLVPLFIGAFFSSCSYITNAEPWFTGPLLAPSGHTVSMGHRNFELLAFDNINLGLYNHSGHFISLPHTDTKVIFPLFSLGVTEKIDVQFAFPYSYSKNEFTSSDGIGDASLVLGYQLLEQQGKIWQPDLRLAFVQILPSGRYDGLSNIGNGLDGNGLGSYQLGIQLNFQHLLTLLKDHYLRSRLSFAYIYANAETISGISVFGGTPQTSGRLKPGNFFGVDIATELTLTQNWVAVMEAQFYQIGGTRFNGIIGKNNDLDIPTTLGHGELMQVALAPAIEYNFSPNIGIIAGPWFSIAGHDTPAFISYALALNFYW